MAADGGLADHDEPVVQRLHVEKRLEDVERGSGRARAHDRLARTPKMAVQGCVRACVWLPLADDGARG